MKNNEPLDIMYIPTVLCFVDNNVVNPNVINNIPTDMMRTDACWNTISPKVPIFIFTKLIKN